MWVGSKTSPNTFKDAIKTYNNIRNKANADSFVVNKCPWCGCKLGKIGKGRDVYVLGYKPENRQFITHCLDKDCSFFE